MAAISESCLNVDADPQQCTVFDITDKSQGRTEGLCNYKMCMGTAKFYLHFRNEWGGEG